MSKRYTCGGAGGGDRAVAAARREHGGGEDGATAARPGAHEASRAPPSVSLLTWRFHELKGPWSDDSRQKLNMTFLVMTEPPRKPSSKLMPARGPLYAMLPTIIVWPLSDWK